MALTTEQLLYINNMLYSDNPPMNGNGRQSSFEGRTLGEFVQSISPSANAADRPTTSAEEWSRMANDILNDPQLKNLEIVDVTYDPATGERNCLLVDPSTNEAVIGFRGTGGGEWKDNFIAGSTMNHGGEDPTISPQQERALDYLEQFDLSKYDKVTVTGHSKGGNKAKLCALLNGEVDNCVSFDGQGFSDEFMEAHAAEIAANQSKIQNHNVDGDFVNLLLNDIGETTYYEGQRIGDNFAKNHDPTSFFDSNGKMHETQQNPEMKELDRFLNSMLRSTDDKNKAEILDFAGEVVDAALGFDKSGDRVKEILTDPRYSDEFAYVLAYMIEYERKTGKVTDSVTKALERMGMGEWGEVFDVVNEIVTDEDVFGIVRTVASYGDDIPDWALDMVAKVLKKKGVNLTADELKQLLKVVVKTEEKLDDIVIHKNDGEDWYVEDDVPVVFHNTLPKADQMPAIQPTYQNVDVYEKVELSGSEGMFILVHFDELLSCSEELRCALEQYNEAVEMVRESGEDLASKWEGAAKDAFVVHQQNAIRWYSSTGIVIDAVIQMIKKLHDIYVNTENSVTKIMQGR